MVEAILAEGQADLADRARFLNQLGERDGHVLWHY
jgi:hypothetical protein